MFLPLIFMTEVTYVNLYVITFLLWKDSLCNVMHQYVQNKLKTYIIDNAMEK